MTTGTCNWHLKRGTDSLVGLSPYLGHLILAGGDHVRIEVWDTQLLSEVLWNVLSVSKVPRAGTHTFFLYRAAFKLSGCKYLLVNRHKFFKNSSPGSQCIGMNAQNFLRGISWPLTSLTCTPPVYSQYTGSAVSRPLLEAHASAARCLGTGTCTWGEERPF